jgi:hypothetical protein
VILKQKAKASNNRSNVVTLLENHPSNQEDHDIQNTTNTTRLPPEIVVDERNSVATKRAAQMADGCYHVFLDCGSNVGVHGRFLFEPHKYPKSKFVTIFDEQFGSNRTQQNICVFAFEPNPLHSVKHSMTQDKYNKMGWRYHYMPFGVSDSDGNLTFYSNAGVGNGAQSEEWGFSRFNLDPSQNNTSYAVVVPLIDLAQWVLNEVSDRIVPEKTKYNQGPPRVMMKMDVEGSEYRTLFRLHKTGVYKLFSAIVGEQHLWTLPQEIEGRQILSRKSLRLFFKDLKSRLEQDGGPGFREFDDEEYLHDRMPYPDPDNASSW